MSYTEYLFNLPNISWTELLTLFLLIFMRITPIIALAPFLGAKLAPMPAKLGLALCLTLIFLPIIAPTIQPPLGLIQTHIGYAVKELFIGLLLGFFISIPFYMAQTSGTLIDYLRGASIMQSQDPTMQSQTSPIGVLYNYVLIVIFFQISGPFLFFDAIAKSYDLFPPNAYLNPLFFNESNPFWKIAFDLINQIVTIGIQIAAPPLVSILMAEMFLGIANRLAPQVQIAFLGMSIKSFLGLLLLWAAWFFILKQLAKHSYDWLQVVDHVIHLLNYLH